MSRRNKLKKFADLVAFSNVYENIDSKQPRLQGENGQIIDLKGKWRALHFKNNNPVILELACGRGEYTLGLSRAFPEYSFIGVDIKGARIWQGARTALEEKRFNVAFLRTRIEQITCFFAPGEVSEIWITFPDPFLKEKKTNRRLTSPAFLERYRQILKKDGIIHLKTDSPELYEYTLEVINDDPKCQLLYKNDDIYAGPLPSEPLAIKTYYEKMHLEAGKPIRYIQFTIH